MVSGSRRKQDASGNLQTTRRGLVKNLHDAVHGRCERDERGKSEFSLVYSKFYRCDCVGRERAMRHIGRALDYLFYNALKNKIKFMQQFFAWISSTIRKNVSIRHPKPPFFFFFNYSGKKVLTRYAVNHSRENQNKRWWWWKKRKKKKKKNNNKNEEERLNNSRWDALRWSYSITDARLFSLARAYI